MYVLIVDILIISVLHGYPGYYTHCNSGSVTRRHSCSSSRKQTFGNIFFRQLSTPLRLSLDFLKLILPLLSLDIVRITQF